MWWFGFLFLIYVLVLASLLFSIININAENSTCKSSQKQFSIIVPFRNETEHLPSLIKSFKDLNYAKEDYEIILVNDHSDDNSVFTTKSFVTQNKHVHLIHLPIGVEGKKAALQKGISASQFKYIVTTDADCCVPACWLKVFASRLKQTKADVIIGSVQLFQSNSFLGTFQYYDTMALQAITFGLANLQKPILCNGANFCYSKAAFLSVSGFEGNEDQPSGDDILLLQKFTKASLSIDYVLHNTVYTYAEEMWKPFVQQRKRWFYKTRYSSSRTQLLLAILFLTINFLWLILAVITILNWAYASIFISCLCAKLGIDFLLTFEMSKKMKTGFCIREFLIANLLYPFAVMFFTVYLTNSNITWKNRNF